MTRLILRRLLLSIPLILVVTALTFLLEAVVPGNAARAMLGPYGTQADYQALVAKLGLNEPLWQQYAHWLSGAVHGNLGQSIFVGEPVTAMLNERLGVTLSLVAGVALLCGTVGVLLGTASAVRGGWFGKAADGFSLLGLALPSFWVGLVLIAVFAVKLHLLPPTGYTSPTASLGGWLAGLVLPVVALSLAGITLIAKQTRDSMLDVLNRDFVRGLRASGLSPASVIWKHALRNAGLPVVSVLGTTLIAALSGAVFVEAVFALPGLGSLAQQATEQHDLPVLEGIALYFTVITVVINLVTDLAYGWLNPKVRAL
jgi:peptide/nickel transport system permease protein